MYLTRCTLQWRSTAGTISATSFSGGTSEPKSASSSSNHFVKPLRTGRLATAMVTNPHQNKWQNKRRHKPNDSVPALGIDLDGTIDQDPGFFSRLSEFWPGPVYIVTYRHDREKAEA